MLCEWMNELWKMVVEKIFHRHDLSWVLKDKWRYDWYKGKANLFRFNSGEEVRLDFSENGSFGLSDLEPIVAPYCWFCLLRWLLTLPSWFYIIVFKITSKAPRHEWTYSCIIDLVLVSSFRIFQTRNAGVTVNPSLSFSMP